MAENGHAPEAAAQQLASVQEAARTLLTQALPLASRQALGYQLGSTHDGARQIEEVLGYKHVLFYRDFKRAYQRYDLAQRLVNAFPHDTWGQTPTIREDNQDDVETPFEQAWHALEERLHVSDVLMRADILANLGHYSIVLIGLRGQTDLAQPATPVRSPEDVLFLQPYSEEYAYITEFGTDPSLGDFAQPQQYRIAAVADPPAGLPRPLRTQLVVHASRVLHLPGELRLDDDIYGLPYLEAVYNVLVDLLKVRGGAAEAIWRDGRRRWGLMLRDGFKLSPEEAERISAEADELNNGWRDVMRAAGMDVVQFDGRAVNPKTHFDILIAALAGTRGIPQRKLVGSEEGRLASTQDEDAYLRDVGRRQVQYAEVLALRPLIQRLADLQVFELPPNGYTVTWENLYALSEAQQAQVAKDKATAINLYEAGRVGAVNAGLLPTLPPPEFRDAVLGIPPESEFDTATLLLPPEDAGLLQPAPDAGTAPALDAGAPEAGTAPPGQEQP
jgi:hypothetical protein